jgi:hypothetical protein
MPSNDSSDPAAIFAIATSLWAECHKHATADRSINLSDAYSGMDGFMREIMRIGAQFEAWACRHVDFDQLTDVWPYMLEDRFGKECLSVLLPENLSDFDEHDCRRVSARLRLTFR